MERKALAIKYAVTELRYYLTGQHLTLVTDYTPVQWIAQVKGSNSHITCWFLSLQDFFPAPAPSRGPAQEHLRLVIKLLIYPIPRVQGSSGHSPLQAIPQVFDRI